ncbi:hypothetical protein PFISCL1PPCAC_18375, partial [Pristionchus fissidentatus]
VHCMERVRKYGSAVAKLYKEEGPASTKAAAYRARVREAIDSLDGTDSSIDRDEVLECAWQLAYYPAARSAHMDDHLRMVLSLLAGELLLLPPSANTFVYVGDLHRYQQTPLSLRLARLYYTRAMMEDTEAARPLNQLSITLDALPAVRCLLHAATCCSNKFRATEKNLEGRIIKMKQSSTVPSLKQLALLLEVSMAEKKAEDETFVTASKEWLQLLSVEREKEKSGGKEKNKSPATAVVNGATASKVAAAGAATTAAYDDLLLQLHCLSLAVGVCHPSNSAALVDVVQCSLLALLEKEKEKEEEEVLKIGSRRRRASESDEDEEKAAIRGRRRRGGGGRRRDSDDDEEEDEKETEPVVTSSSKSSPNADSASSGMLLPSLAIALEWISRVDRGRAEGDGRYAATKVIKEKMKFEQIVSVVLQRLHELQGIGERVDSLPDPAACRKSLVRWRVVERLNGKERGEDGDDVITDAIALWTATIVREEGSIQRSTTGFGARNDHSLMRKMAALHMNAQSNKSERPTSIVLQAGVLERRLGKIRALAERSHLLWYVPASELAALDDAKSSSKAARDALRFIETEQHTRVRVMPSGGVREALARAAIDSPPTALLSLDTAKDSESLPPHTQCLHVDSFAHSYK